MSAKAAPSRETIIDAMKSSMEAALRVPEGVAEPVAILWTDADGQWRPLIPALQVALPQLYLLGDYNPAARMGPVIWLRCVVDRALPDVALPEGATPVLYLPGVSRQQLRAGGECPRHLQPLIELQFRGTVWHQRNGRDWTVEAFLTSVDTLDLDMAIDMRTKEAMMRALPLLATEPFEGLRGRRLEAEDFDRLAVGDPIRDLLAWLSDGEGFRSRCDGARWETFRSVCKREFGIDPDETGTTQAGERLLDGEGKWEEVWQRFCEAPQVYAGVAGVLRDTAPRDLLTDPARQPAKNGEEEAQLRIGLEVSANLPHSEACARILALEKAHGMRRGWVWARLGESPLALLLEPLARMAGLAEKTLGGPTVKEIAEAYATNGWRCDAAAMDAVAKASSAADSTLVCNVLTAIYKPWLEESARHFQETAAKDSDEFRKGCVGVVPEAETCIVFADGLRLDVAGRLQESLESRGFRVRVSHRIAPIPSVTATAKPIVSPVHKVCEETAVYGGLTPAIGELQKPANAQRLRDEMARQGIEVIGPGELSIPSGSQKGGWTEIGQLDSRGHALGAGLAQQISKEVEAIAERVAELLSGGWSKVRVVTDHGWLLLPGGLPKVELPTYLTETKWARCAVAPGETPKGFPVFSWHWNPHVQVVSPPGIGSFFAGMEYAHGGVSPQECIVPDLIVERGAEAIKARIEDIRWRGMRCRVSVRTNVPGVKVDLRLHARNAESSIAMAAKEIDENGDASLAVEHDRHEGAAATVVLLDSAGHILDQKPTRVGEES
jgi:hypothetical protein